MMYITNPLSAFVYRFIYVILCLTGLLYHFLPFQTDTCLHMLSYFTIQVNLFCLVQGILLLKNSFLELKTTNIHKRKKLREAYRFTRGMGLFSIMVVFLAFNFVLHCSGFSMAKGCPTSVSKGDIYVHYLIPLMTCLDFILFQPKGHYRYADAIYWLVFPILYYFISTIKTAVQSCAYPYYFLDMNALGIPAVLHNSFLFMLICFLFGNLLVASDHLLAKVL